MSGDPKIGMGGGPTRATILPTDGKERKKYPLFSGLLEYFPDALCAVANLSWRGNEQHNPGQPLHWARGKSTDEADTLLRHLAQSGTIDSDGVRHSAKVAWRALALLQKEIEGEGKADVAPAEPIPPVAPSKTESLPPIRCDSRYRSNISGIFWCTLTLGHEGEHEVGDAGCKLLTWTDADPRASYLATKID